jgi:hypothetical protein
MTVLSCVPRSASPTLLLVRVVVSGLRRADLPGYRSFRFNYTPTRMWDIE